MSLAHLLAFKDICARCETAEPELGSYLCPACTTELSLPPVEPVAAEPTKRRPSPRVGCTRNRRTMDQIKLDLIANVKR